MPSSFTASLSSGACQTTHPRKNFNSCWRKRWYRLRSPTRCTLALRYECEFAPDVYRLPDVSVFEGKEPRQCSFLASPAGD